MCSSDLLSGLAAVERQLGLVAEERGDYAAALEAYRRVLRVREQAGDTHGVAESLNDIGYAHYQLGDYDSAQVFWRQAGEGFARLDDPRGAIRARQNLGLLYIARGRWNDARTLLEDSLTEAQRRQLAEETAVSLRNLAELEVVQGRLGAALDRIGRAEALFRELEDHRGRVDVALLRARALAAIGAVDRAEAALAEVESDIVEASREQQTIAALVRTELARRRTDHGALRRGLTEARRLADASGVASLRLAVDVLAESQPERALEAIRALGDIPLLLSWYDLALQRTIAAGDFTTAASHYRSAADQLAAHGDYAGAFTLHRLGAKALAALGDTGAAETARSAAATALERLTDDLPDSLRGLLDNDPAVVAFREASA